MTNKRQKIVRISLLAMFSAIIIGMTFTPYLGYITIPGMLSITTIHIIVIVSAIAMNNYLDGAILGAVWGVSCLLYALSNGTADSAIFLDPKISVIPRILVGILVVACYRIANIASKNKYFRIAFQILVIVIFAFLVGVFAKNISDNLIISIIFAVIAALFCFFLFTKFGKNVDTMPMFFSALGGTFSNTVLVLTAINLFGSQGLIDLTGTIKNIFSTVIALNGSIEIVAAVVIAVPCCFAVKKAMNKFK